MFSLPRRSIQVYHGTIRSYAMDIVAHGLRDVGRHLDPVLGRGFYAFIQEQDAADWSLPMAYPGDPAAIVRITMSQRLYTTLEQARHVRSGPWSPHDPSIQVVFAPASFAALNGQATFAYRFVDQGSWTPYQP